MVLMAVAWPAAASAADKPTGCTVKISGGLEQSFACRAELKKLNAWIFEIGGKSGLPFDFGGILTFAGEPKAGQTYELKDLENASQSVRDKHDKEGNSWSASASKSIPKFGPKKIPDPVGSLTLKLTAVGPEPAVHGTLTVTLKPETFNKNKQDVVMSFEF
jgi:hypothetical protein